MYLQLPKPPTATDTDTAATYGDRLFVFILETGVTATLDDRQLALAEYAGARASSTAGYLVCTYDRLSAVRRDISAAIRGRATAAAPADATTAAAPAERPNLGPMAPLTPAPIVRPPSGTAARYSPAERQAVADSIPF